MRGLLLVTVLLLISFLGLNHGLWTPDEPREAEIAREMSVAPGIIPTLGGQRFLEKPPLYYWVVAATYRLAGAPSPLAARLVSACAGALTVLALFFWGWQAHSRTAGLLAATMLATSVQFVISAHWILIDPLLMLLTTLAAWCAWLLLSGRDSNRLRAGLYIALALALWIKGLIGPVLVCSGVAAYSLIDRAARPRLLRPIWGLAVLAAALVLLALGLWRQGGTAALWEWGYVNHVERALNPSAQLGHRQPILYYFWTLPMALLPWLAPFIDALAHAKGSARGWRGLGREPDLRHYCMILCAAMFVVLSLSATKRETYLLPLLPPLFLWLGVHLAHRWRSDAAAVRASVLWWPQLALIALLLLAPPLYVYWRFMPGDTAAAVLSIVAAALCMAMLYGSVRSSAQGAAAWLLAGALAAIASALLLAPHALDATKNMAPFLRAVDHDLPPGAPVYATDVDETLEALVPFVTGRALIALASPQLPVAALSELPEWILVQNNHNGRAFAPPPDYALARSQAFGPGRSLALWHRVPQR
jgi:4-amino-4-deoxy-L-arabinose transferase-like glycosyltransferase